MFSLRAEGFSCSLDVLYGGLGISKLKFVIKKILIFSALHFFQLVILIVIQTKMLDSYPESINPDPKHCNVSSRSHFHFPFFFYIVLDFVLQ
jgi:hypothetical protein